jgi:uncharacterized protein YodC (DUF2158 family)
MEQELRVGDKVQLKSGGPMMTVNEVNPEYLGEPQTNKVNCVWFNEAKEAMHRQFPKATLLIVD